MLDEAEIIAGFCQKLKSLRLAKGFTLEEFGQKSGVSISTLSKIENQQQKPSFETVLRVARALQMNFIQMLDAPEEAPRAMARRVITRAADAPEYPSALYDYHTHASDLSRKTMVPLLMRVKTRDVPPPADWSTHEGEEFLYVLEGLVELHSEQYAPVRLNRGDSCYMDSTMRHAYVAKGEGDAMILTICLAIVPFREDG